MTPRAQPPSRQPAKSSYHHGDLPRALCQAAAMLIETGQPLTLRATARAAGVSAAAPYRHFADRDALLAEVLTQGFRELEQVTEQARAATGDPWDRLRAVGTAYLAFAAAHPRLYRLMFGPECDKASHAQLMAASHEAFDVLRRTVDECGTEGFHAGADPTLIALAGWSMMHGLASLHADGKLPGVEPVALASTFIGFLIHGVGPRKPRPPAPGKR